ncbi:beta strand repeat-containing protein [Thiomicrospira microaerophila]|uniref:beta strand repeat-containing protein n=1 Tax=Thiomicrospira microaerophila TaxID=406020 RepID=UPI0005CB6B9C|nr:invasin domain 3-containing protein [Thiomicrospira microaerophila]
MKSIKSILLLLATLTLIACNGADEELAQRSSNPPPVGQSTNDPAATNQTLKSITLSALGAEAPANAITAIGFQVLAIGSADLPMPNQAIDFLTTLGSLSESSATTDSNGLATVFLTSSQVGVAKVTASVAGFVENATTTFTASQASSVSLTAIPLNTQPGRYSTLLAEVLDVNGLKLIGEAVTFAISTNNSGAYLTTDLTTDFVYNASQVRVNSLSATTDAFGRAMVYYRAGSNGGGLGVKDVVEAISSNGINSTAFDINVGTAAISNLLGSIELTPRNNEINANASSTVAIDVVTYDLNSSAGAVARLPNTQLTLTTTSGLLSASASNFFGATDALTISTDDNGSVRVFLQASTQATTALIRAYSEGVSAQTSVQFRAAQPSAANSTLVSSPSSLPADGLGTSVITLSLRDANNNLVADGTQVTLQTTAGAIISTNPATTTLGRATFTLQAPSIASNATLSILEYPSITGAVTFGSETNSNPANLEFNIANKQLYVFGVGKQDTTSLTITVKTASGNLIDDAEVGVNNLRVSLKTRPNAGEKLIGKDASGNVVETSSGVSTLPLRTLNGVATLTLQSGTLPGVVEIEAEALMPNGDSLAPRLIGVVPQVSIASGPPHSINLSYPVANAVSNLGNGVYRRVGSAFVTDRFGNAVPDGTVISLGVLDSVIASNNPSPGYAVNTGNPDSNASFDSGTSLLRDNTNSPFLGSITRNNTSRGLKNKDRVLLLNAQSEDKSRFVDNFTANTVTANKNYQSQTVNSSLVYVAGASLLSSQIDGMNMLTGTPVRGQAITKDGYATFYLRYPADELHILTGCFQDNPTLDTRESAAPAGSAQVWVVAESSETGATTVDNRACFSALHDFELINNGISSDGSVSVTLRDATLIPLPFVSLSSYVSYETNTGLLAVSVGNCSGRTDQRTNANGNCRLPINVTGGASGDSATVTISAGGNASPISISFTIP